MKPIFTSKACVSLKAFAFLLWSLSTINGYAQCSNAPTLKFHSPILIGGTDKQPGAVYLFANVIPGVDAHIEVVDLVGGATLYNIDDTTGIGYYDAFQPYVGAAANDTSYIDWRITFKAAGTSTNVSLPCLAVTGVDVDGDGAYLKEFIEAATPGSISVDPFTALQVSFDGVRSKAMSTIANVPLIDTARLDNMFQMNFSNINTLLYRNGAISTYGAEQIRQTCIYFKPFFNTYMLLPVRLLSFTGKSTERSVDLNWLATNEEYVKEYVVQKSADNIQWNDIKTIAKGASFTKNQYFMSDLVKNSGAVHYRLKQIDIKGSVTYSRIIKLSETAASINRNFLHNTIFTSAIHLQISAQDMDQYTFDIYTIQGKKIMQRQHKINAGINAVSLELPATLTSGMYLMMTKNKTGQQIYSSKVIKN